MPRKVEPAGTFHQEVLNDFRSPSKACVSGADLLLEELEEQDPDPDERCGLLADRHELYAMRVPGCRHLVLLVSLDRRGADTTPCLVHGLVPLQRCCDTARQRATRHLDLINPSWEPD